MSEHRVRISKSGQLIQSLEEWRLYAPPKGKDRHWEDGRSAKELARAWCEQLGTPAAPRELVTLLEASALFNEMVLENGFPEDRTPFDSYAGEPRNADLNLIGSIQGKRVAISVEGKADETFGRSVRATLAAAEKRSAAGRKSNGVARITELGAALFREDIQASEGYLDLPYQLLTGVAGVLAWAKRISAKTALFVVHEFVGGRRKDGRLATSVQKLEKNARALNAFVSALAGSNVTVSPGQVVGPLQVPGNEHIPGTVPLYVGKARRPLGRAGA